MNKPVQRFIVEIPDGPAAQRFRNLLECLEKSSNWGASREFTIEWDGDGPDKLKTVDTNMDPSFSKKDFDSVLDYSLIRVLASGPVPAPFVRKVKR